jgi:RNA ligase (TIGR02306 family)
MYKNGQRIMAWIARISDIQHIENADNITTYRVGGWWVVDQKNRYNIGDLVIYVSIDSWVPNSIAPFLSKGTKPRLYNNVLGERLKTIKLRGKVSQGLILPIEFINENVHEGMDVSSLLNIQKYEAPIPAQLSGKIRGAFPSFISKTDQERIQNLDDEFKTWQEQKLTWEVTEKLDGSSMTVYVYNKDQGVCSRNLNLLETDENTFWQITRKNNLIEKLKSTRRNLALQGELIGEGIQKNNYKLRGHDFYIFDIFDIDANCYFKPEERQKIVQELDILHVPIIHKKTMILKDFDLLTYAEGKSILKNNREREGLVYKCHEQNLSFKVISNKFLLKQKN